MCARFYCCCRCSFTVFICIVCVAFSLFVYLRAVFVVCNAVAFVVVCVVCVAFVVLCCIRCLCKYNHEILTDN